jgi:hypothetical protein
MLEAEPRPVPRGSVFPGPVPAALQPRVRGSLVRTARETAIEFWGENRLGEIADRLSRDTQARVLDAPIIADPWLPERFIMEWYGAVFQGPCKGTRTLYNLYLDHWMNNCIGRVRRLLLSSVDPAGLAPRASELWRYDHTTGHLDAEVQGEREIVMTLSNHLYATTPVARDSITEIFRHIISLSCTERVMKVEWHELPGRLIATMRWT